MFRKKFWGRKDSNSDQQRNFGGHNLTVAVIQSTQKLEEAVSLRGSMYRCNSFTSEFPVLDKYLIHPKRKISKKENSASFHLEISELLEREQNM